VLNLFKQYDMKAYWGSGFVDPHFLHFGSGTGLFSFEEITPWYLSSKMLGGRCGNNFWPYWHSNSYPSVVQLVVSRYTNAIGGSSRIFCTGSFSFHLIPYTDFSKLIKTCSCWSAQISYNAFPWRFSFILPSGQNRVFTLCKLSWHMHERDRNKH
jgi:hypothetical protein